VVLRNCRAGRKAGGIPHQVVRPVAVPHAFTAVNAARAQPVAGPGRRPVASALPQRALSERLDDFVPVSEDDLRRATLLMLETIRNLVAPAQLADLLARRPAGV
jgi:hypothetical protein